MKQFGEFVPVLVFVAVYYLAGIYYATAALMVAVTVQVVALRLLERPITQQLKVTFWLSLVFGALTLAFQDRTFIQWKPTIINWAFSLALIVSQLIGGRTLLERALGGQLKLSGKVWKRLNSGWAAAFALSGALNLYVAYRFSEAFWVNYKLIGGFGLTLLYVVATVLYLHVGGHLAHAEPAPNTERPR